MSLPAKNIMETYINNKRHLIRVICRTNQWSGLGEKKITDWVRNFGDIEGKYIGIKLFLNSLYYSERNIIDLLKYSIFEQIISEEIKKNQLSSGSIYASKSSLNSEIKKQLNKTLFIPLSDNINPSESGLALAKYLTNELHIYENQVMFHFQLTENVFNEFERIIILDDCVGSGQQIKNFWNGNGDFSGLKSIIPFREIPTYFLALIGYDKPILDLQIDGYTEGLRVKINQVLTDNNRVFRSCHKTWRNDKEREFSIEYLKEISKNKGLSLLGFNEFDFAVFLHNTAPDWTLPLFWQHVEGEWVNLVNRKNNIL